MKITYNRFIFTEKCKDKTSLVPKDYHLNPTETLL